MGTPMTVQNSVFVAGVFRIKVSNGLVHSLGSQIVDLLAMRNRVALREQLLSEHQASAVLSQRFGYSHILKSAVFL